LSRKELIGRIQIFDASPISWRRKLFVQNCFANTNKRWGSLLHLDVLGRAGLTMKKPLTATAAADSITRAMSLVHHHRHHHHHAMSVSAEERG